MIEAERLTKRYGVKTAVADLSFTVQPGEVLGFLGPNGAGKSTTMKMITGFIAPTSGTARVCGHDVLREPMKARTAMGYLPEGAPSYGEMTVRQFLHFIADVRTLRGDNRRERLAHVIDALHLGTVLTQPIDTLSKGFRRRVGIAQAIIHDPRVVILDEPTDGLDPNQKHEVRELINGLAADRTVIISTHILEEVHALCSRVIIIAGGRLLADDTPAALEASSRYNGAVSLSTPQWRAAAEAIGALPEVAHVETDDRLERVTALPTNGGNLFTAVRQTAENAGWTITGLELERGRLDEVFRRLTEGDVAREQAA